MTTLKKWRLHWVIVCALICFLDACQNESNVVSPSPALDHDKIAELVEKSSQVSDGADDEAITAAYKALTSEELDYFYDLRTQHDLERLNKNYRDPNSSLSSARINAVEFETAKNNIVLAGNLRKQLNNLSRTRYGITGNKMNAMQLEGLTRELLNMAEYARLTVQRVSTDNNARTQACTVVSLPRRAYKATNGGVDWFTYYDARWDVQTDCDLIFAYHGDRNHMRGETYWDRAMLNDFGNVLPQRYTGASDLLMGYWRVIAYIGYPGLVDVTMRWGA